MIAMLASPSASPPPAVDVRPAAQATANSPLRRQAPIRIVRYGFENAELGMSLAQWRGSEPDHASAPCKPAAQDQQVLVCEPEAEFGGAYSKQDRRAVFVNGQLAGLAFSTSIDSFDGVMARLDKTYGRPARVVRDTIRLGDGLVLPHVLMTWTNGLATIRITDPEPPGGLLTVRATLDADAGRIPASRS